MRYLLYETEPGRYSYDLMGSRPVSGAEAAGLVAEASMMVVMQTWRESIEIATFEQDPNFWFDVKTKIRRYQPFIAYNKGRVIYPPFLRDGDTDKPRSTFDDSVEQILLETIGGRYAEEPVE